MGPGATDGRRQRSMRTRARVVDAGEQLFVERGYLATTIEAVAERAGVAAQTVYYVFGTKRNLLAAVLDASIAGDVEPVAVLERPWFDELETAGDADLGRRAPRRGVGGDPGPCIADLRGGPAGGRRP